MYLAILQHLRSSLSNGARTSLSNYETARAIRRSSVFESLALLFSLLASVSLLRILVIYILCSVPCFCRAHLLPPGPRQLSAPFVVITIFVSNFIGVVFARTLHYQFYSWYFHTIPYMIWHSLHYSGSEENIAAVSLGFLIMATIELCFNVYPATWWSSLLLQV